MTLTPKKVGVIFVELEVLPSLTLTASSPLEIDGWKMIFHFFQGRSVSFFRECMKMGVTYNL